MLKPSPSDWTKTALSSIVNCLSYLSQTADIGLWEIADRYFQNGSEKTSEVKLIVRLYVLVTCIKNLEMHKV